MQIIHTSYIKNMSDKTGKTYRELESLWDKYEREVENDRMMDPNKFSHLRKMQGTLAEEVKRRFESELLNPELPEEEIALEEETEELANEFEENLEEPQLSEEGELEETEEVTEETLTEEGEEESEPEPEEVTEEAEVEEEIEQTEEG